MIKHTNIKSQEETPSSIMTPRIKKPSIHHALKSLQHKHPASSSLNIHSKRMKNNFMRNKIQKPSQK